MGEENRCICSYAANECCTRFFELLQEQSIEIGCDLQKMLFPKCTEPKPPLCKGRWAGVSLLGGVVNPSVSFADSSLYTREPFLR